MTNIKQSLLVALCTLVSISVANTVHASTVAPRSIRAGGCVLRRSEAVAQQAQPISQQRPTMQAPIDEPEAITLQAKPMSQKLPTMQAPATLDINEPAVEEVDVLAPSNESEELPASDNATEQSALDIETSASDIILEPNASKMPEEEITLL